MRNVFTVFNVFILFIVLLLLYIILGDRCIGDGCQKALKVRPIKIDYFGGSSAEELFPEEELTPEKADELINIYFNESAKDKCNLHFWGIYSLIIASSLSASILGWDVCSRWWLRKRGL